MANGSFWNYSDEMVLDVLITAAKRMGYFFAERGEKAYEYHEYKYAEQDVKDARAELEDRLKRRLKRGN